MSKPKVMATKRYTALIIGLGSIGRRHARILKESARCIIFALREKTKTREDNSYIDDYLFSWNDIDSHKIDFAIVANPSALHMGSALLLAQKGIPFIIEKPVCVSSKDAKKLVRVVKGKNLPVLVGFNLRYHSLYQKVKELLCAQQLGRPLSLFVETGYYLPAWRNYDYKKSYSVSRR
ncbi:MAG: Gfo/Idh/MocA family oxidoreductase, partial [Candidatus Omnitrophota bacterium]